VSLSTHTARATGESYRLRLRPVGSSCCQLTRSIPTLVARPLPFTDITPLQRYYGALRPWLTHLYFRPRGSPFTRDIRKWRGCPVMRRGVPVFWAIVEKQATGQSCPQLLQVKPGRRLPRQREG